MKNMNHLDDLIKCCVNRTETDSPAQHDWSRRAVLQLMYAVKLSETADNCYTELIEGAIELAWQALMTDGAVTKTTCQAVERHLAPLAEKAKAYTLICVGHAHIDMNWMWAYDETVSVTLETFRTMLDLMDEYPDFTYAQSQASVYEIVARHDPDLLDRIRERIREGRWEVTASTWVEADRNLPNAESMARHFLYTRNYLAALLQIDPATLDLDYEPDTFGHHRNVPEVLCDAGVRYYYHCRGAEGPYLSRWQAPSGRSILVYREQLWYNWDMDGRCALVVPQLCHDLGMTAALRVYGVGDHGGGPTRRDIEKILEMDTWPIFPHYRFGTYHDFFRQAEKIADQLPVVSGELNFIFDGCYTTQTRIKRGNRQAEKILLESELSGALAAAAAGHPYAAEDYTQAWKKVLFNQFHDILPGSGTTDTREYAMASYQEAYALANTQLMKAMRAIAARIDTTGLAAAEDIRFTRAEGAGAGFPTGSGNLPRTARHSGLHRLFTVYNPLPYEREEVCELTIWDWPGDAGRLQVSDGCGGIFRHQVVDGGIHQYWGHRYQTILVQVRVPAAGYRVLVIDEKPLQTIAVNAHDVRKIKPDELVLENDCLRVVVSGQDGTIQSLLDKETRRDYADPCEPSGLFRLINEDASRGMTAWVVGPYRQISSLHQQVTLTSISHGDLRQSIAWTADFGNGSNLAVTLSLDQGERLVRLDVQVRWQEIGGKKTGLPQLNLFLPVPGGCRACRYDIPMGEIERPPLPHDVPASSYGLAPVAGARALLLTSNSKYGFRGTPEGLALTLIRSSIDPDPWPEVGEHRIRIGIALVDDDQSAPGLAARGFNHPLHALPLRQGQPGDWPLQRSLFALQGDGVFLSSVKQAENGKALIVRLFSQSSRIEPVSLTFWQKPSAVSLTDLMEQRLPAGESQPIIDGPSVRLNMKPYSLQTLSITL